MKKVVAHHNKANLTSWASEEALKPAMTEIFIELGRN